MRILLDDTRANTTDYLDGLTPSVIVFKLHGNLMSGPVVKQQRPTPEC
jgi:hypothetical protein